jgi:Fe(3+) dicitrate transport protein
MSFIDSRYGISKPSLRQELAKILPLPKTIGQPSRNAPRYIHNLGLSWSNNFRTMQYRMSGRVLQMQTIPQQHLLTVYTGLLEGYHVFDLATEYKFKKNYNLKAGSIMYLTSSIQPVELVVILDQEFYLKVKHSTFQLGQNFN